MNVWMVGVEMAPYAKVGGLGDVLGALPQALVELGCEVTVILPHLPGMDRTRFGITSTGLEVEALVDGAVRKAEILEAEAPGGVRVLFINYPPYYHREGLYGTPAGDFPDNAQRFAFFCYAALEAGKRVAPGVHVVHSHDWQAGLVPLLVCAPEHYGADPALGSAATVHTIHNLSYQGLFPSEVLPTLGISWSHFNFREMEFYGLVNFLKTGLAFADAITTVSPTYAREIQTYDYAWGLEGLLRQRSTSLYGILNGIDTGAWDPATDPHIRRRFTREELGARRENRDELRARFGLSADGGPVVGIVNRLVAQKGIDLLLGLEGKLESLGLQWAILGSGDGSYESAVAQLARRHRGTVGAFIGFDELRAREIYAGSDFFCMPSFFEPCGLGQMIALRYGSLPIVRKTGGLADTVPDLSEPGGVGLLFEDPTPDALEVALGRAAALARDPAAVEAARGRAMDLDFSWDASARRYLEVYRSIL